MSCYFSGYYFLQLCRHIDILTKFESFRREERTFLHFGWGISKSWVRRQNSQKWSGTKKEGDQDYLKKMVVGTY